MPEQLTPATPASEASGPTETMPGDEEIVGSVSITPETLVAALENQSQLAREGAREELKKKQEKAQENLEVLMTSMRERAADQPQYYSDPVLNRYEKGRRKREKEVIEAENLVRAEKGQPEQPLPTYPDDPDYTIHGKDRWGVAALEGNSLGAKNRREARKSRKAATIASRNLGTKMAKEELERDSRKEIDADKARDAGMTDEEIKKEQEKINEEKRLGGRRHGGFAIDPATGRSRFREFDPKLKEKSRLERKMIRGAERTYRKVARKHRNEEHYLINQGKRFTKRHNIRERAQENAALKLARFTRQNGWRAAKSAGSRVDRQVGAFWDGIYETPAAFREGQQAAATPEGIQKVINKAARKAGRVYGKLKRKENIPGSQNISELNPTAEQTIIMLGGITEGVSTESGLAHAIAGEGFRTISFDYTSGSESASQDNDEYHASYHGAKIAQASEILENSVDAENPAILVGHSQGAQIAVKTALEHPKLVRHLILTNPAGLFDDSFVRLGGRFGKETVRKIITPTRLAQKQQFNGTREMLAHPKSFVGDAIDIANTNIVSDIAQLRQLGVRVDVLVSAKDQVFPWKLVKDGMIDETKPVTDQISVDSVSSYYTTKQTKKGNAKQHKFAGKWAGHDQPIIYPETTAKLIHQLVDQNK